MADRRPPKAGRHKRSRPEALLRLIIYRAAAELRVGELSFEPTRKSIRKKMPVLQEPGVPPRMGL